MRRLQILALAIGLTLATVACGESVGTTAVAALDEAPAVTVQTGTSNPLATSYVDTYQAVQTTEAPQVTGDATQGFGDYIPGEGFFQGVDTSTIPGYEFIDQDSVNIGFLVCPLFFRDLSQ